MYDPFQFWVKLCEKDTDLFDSIGLFYKIQVQKKTFDNYEIQSDLDNFKSCTATN